MFTFEELQDGTFRILIDGEEIFEIENTHLPAKDQSELRGMISVMVDSLNQEAKEREFLRKLGNRD